MLIGDMDSSGSLNAHSLLHLSDRIRAKAVFQVRQSFLLLNILCTILFPVLTSVTFVFVNSGSHSFYIASWSFSWMSV